MHVTALPGDYYHFDALHHRLTGEHSGRSFRLGDSVEVRVARVDLDERKIDFELVVGLQGSKKGPSAGRKSKAGVQPALSDGLPVEPERGKSRAIKEQLLTGMRQASKKSRPETSTSKESLPPSRSKSKPKSKKDSGGYAKKAESEASSTSNRRAPRKRKATS